jgi:predicted ATPase
MAMRHHGDAAELATMADDMIDETGEASSLSNLRRLQATIALAEGDTLAAEEFLVTALDVARKQGAKLWELRAAIDLAGLWRDQGKTAEAMTLLQPIHDSIAEGDCPEERGKAQALLTVLAG